MNVTKEMINELEELRDEQKFLPEFFYPGAPSESIRLEVQLIVNKTLEELIMNIEKNPSKSYVLSEFEKMLSKNE